MVFPELWVGLPESGVKGMSSANPAAPAQLPRSATMTAAVTPMNVPSSMVVSSAAWSASAVDSGRGSSGNGGNSPSA